MNKPAGSDSIRTRVTCVNAPVRLASVVSGDFNRRAPLSGQLLLKNSSVGSQPALGGRSLALTSESQMKANHQVASLLTRS